ncbi:MAG: aminodeoxychorismate synthase component I [Rhodospirillaceae bacterium]
MTPVLAPILRQLPYIEPERALQAFAGEPGAAFLDSAANLGGRGRYSYIAIDPVVTLEHAANDPGDPFARLAEALGRAAFRPVPELPPFQGGAVGYLAYEAGRHLERLPEPAAAGVALPEMRFGIYDTLLAFDHERRLAWAVALDLPAAAFDVARPAAAWLAALCARIAEAPPLAPLQWATAGSWRAEVSRQCYEAMVARTVEYIHAGDILQANVTQRFLGRMPAGLSPWMLYRRACSVSPNPYGAYLDCGVVVVVASASPEMFLRLDNAGRVFTRPIKGTRPRGAGAAEDARLAAVLTASVKDRAENLMIVDLMRNDLARACRIGSVRVNELFGLESFASVHHLVSEIEGRLNPGLGPVDLLRAIFPGGSITGAPKVRAMEVIRELEPAWRGPYCGSVAWIGFDGAMDSSIVIRTLVIDGDAVVVQAGGGIVADSDPAAEYAESLDKVAALLSALDPSWRHHGLAA